MKRGGDGNRFLAPQVDAGDADAGGEQALVAAHDLLMEREAGAAQAGDRAHHLQLVVEPRRGVVVGRDRAHDEADALLAQQALLGDAERAQPLGAGALAEAQVVGVIDHAAGVGVFVVHANRPAEHRWRRGGGVELGRDVHRSILAELRSRKGKRLQEWFFSKSNRDGRARRKVFR